jgi:hypothetical protein
MTCGMAGCEDLIEFTITGQWQLNGAIDTFDICGSCAAYWLRKPDNWAIKISNLAKN